MNFNLRYKYLNSLVLSSLLLFNNTTFAQPINHTNMRGARYCEIILAKGLTEYSVYNTWGFNTCPQKVWEKLSRAKLIQETGASFVYFNGPQYWVIDGYKNLQKTNPIITTQEGFSLQKVGALSIKVANLVKASAPYYKHQVQHKTTFIYEAGKPIYELIDEKGDAYLMQSYSTEKSEQTVTSLSQLGATLKLPKGWTFKTGILQKPIQVNAINNLATIIRDNLDNTYQRASHDVLRES
jgi:hypothetical protein